MNYFYCPECGFEYLDDKNRGYFGEPVSRIIPKGINGKQIDYLLHCPICSSDSCGVMQVSEEDLQDKSYIRSVIEYSKDKKALRNVP